MKIRWTRIVAALVAATALGAGAKGLREVFPLGVYTGWERNGYNAQVAGVGESEYVDRLLGICRGFSCDTIWVVNGPRKNRGEFLAQCEKHGMKALLNSDLQTLFYQPFTGDWNDLDAKIAKSVAELAGFDSFLGYVLKDEPATPTVDQIDAFAKALKRADPAKRDSLVVASPWSFQPFLESSSLETVCTDIYYFGGDKAGGKPFCADGDIPAPSDQSLWWFKRTARNAVKAARRCGKNPWIMLCAFGGGDGNIYLDGRRRYMAAGSYHLYRMPTPAEIKWQAWESVRLGFKGIFYYVLTTERTWESKEEMLLEKNAKMVKARFDRAKRSASGRPRLEERDLEIDYALGLMCPGLEPSPQFAAVGDVFARLARHRARLLAAEPADFPAFHACDPICRAATFMWDDTTDRLGVLVNDDVSAAREVEVLVPSATTQVRDLNGGVFELSPARDGMKSFKVSIAPGDGLLARISFANGHAGMGLCREDFDRIHRRGRPEEGVGEGRPGGSDYGIFAETSLKLKEGADSSRPAWRISRLATTGRPWNVSLLNLNIDKKQAWVRLTLDGDFLDGVSLSSVIRNDEKNEQTFWKSGDPLPVTLPVGTTDLKIRLANPKTEVRDLVVWAEPLQGNGGQ